MNRQAPRFPDGDSVATKALSLRIYGYATPRGWDLTIAECAEALGVEPARVRRIAQLRQWTSQFRATMQDRTGYAGATLGFDEDIDRIGGAW